MLNEQLTIVISAGLSRGKSFGLNVNGPMKFPAEYAIMNKAATVHFLVYPAIFVETKDSAATNAVGDAWAM